MFGKRRDKKTEAWRELKLARKMLVKVLKESTDKFVLDHARHRFNIARARYNIEVVYAKRGWFDSMFGLHSFHPQKHIH